MTAYSKFNIVYRLQKWMDSVPGQTFLNYAYSWGAAIVILGTLFKLTHLPGANFFLFLGMGTEVFVFFISAFDRPFDKTADGRELPTHLTEEDLEGVTADAVSEHVEAGHYGAPTGGGTIIIGGGGGQPAASGEAIHFEGESSGAAVVQGGAAVMQGGAGVVQGGAAVLGGGIVSQQENTPELADAQTTYVEELKKLTETLTKITEQNNRLISDSEEMENLNRTITGISRVYEMQLKSASSQMGTIDEINGQSRKLAEQIAELNRIYARMIEAMTVNMPGSPKQ